MDLSSNSPREISLGFTAVSALALALIGRAAIEALLARHASGDWGNVSAWHARANKLALDQGYFIRSEFSTRRASVHILTADDRTQTFVFAFER